MRVNSTLGRARRERESRLRLRAVGSGPASRRVAIFGYRARAREVAREDINGSIFTLDQAGEEKFFLNKAKFRRSSFQ